MRAGRSFPVPGNVNTVHAVEDQVVPRCSRRASERVLINACIIFFLQERDRDLSSELSQPIPRAYKEGRCTPLVEELMLECNSGTGTHYAAAGRVLCREGGWKGGGMVGHGTHVHQSACAGFR